MSTVASVFGKDVADELAKLAIDIAVEAPIGRKDPKGTTYVRWQLVLEARLVLDAAGVDWRKLHLARAANRREWTAGDEGRIRELRVKSGDGLNDRERNELRELRAREQAEVRSRHAKARS